MKPLLTLLFAALFVSASVHAQIFWTENFESGSTGGLFVTAYTGPNGAWTQTITGSEGTSPNPWYVSCAENGHTAGICGTGCVPVTTTATGATLHVGSTILGDMGASYFSGSAPNATTDRRAESPTINCTGKYTITMKFYYIMNGQSGFDYATVWYYDGSTWSLLSTPPLTTVCGSGQGQWTSYSVALPTSANNNANVKIGFRWVNNNDAMGTDPSFAVDSVNLSTPSGVTASFTASSTSVCQDSCITFTNTSTGGATSYTWSCSSGYTSTASSLAPVTVCFSVAGVYTMSLTATGSGSISHTTQTVTVNAAPAAISGSHRVCVGFTDPLNCVTSGGVWSSSNTAVATVGSASGIVTGVATGVTNISYTLSTGCYAVYSVTVTPLPCTTGIPQMNTGPSADVELFPNPAANELTIRAGQLSYISYTVTNAVGRTFLSGDLTGAQTHVNVKQLPAGLYYITLHGDVSYTTRKFVKE